MEAWARALRGMETPGNSQLVEDLILRQDKVFDVVLARSIQVAVAIILVGHVHTALEDFQWMPVRVNEFRFGEDLQKEGDSARVDRGLEDEPSVRSVQKGQLLQEGQESLFPFPALRWGAILTKGVVGTKQGGHDAELQVRRAAAAQGVRGNLVLLRQAEGEPHVVHRPGLVHEESQQGRRPALENQKAVGKAALEGVGVRQARIESEQVVEVCCASSRVADDEHRVRPRRDPFVLRPVQAGLDPRCNPVERGQRQ